MDNNSRDIIIKFVELIDKKNSDFKNIQENSSKKENVNNENSK